MSMSVGSLSGQFMVIRNSAFISTAPVLAVGLISANAMNTMNVRPSTTLNSMSVNGTKGPPSLPCSGSSSNIAVALEHRDDMDLGHLGYGVHQFHNGHAKEEILQLEQKGGPDAG